MSNICIDRDFHCYTCDYNLRGLIVGDKCPECGTTIPPYREQPLLSSYDPAWRRRVGWGLWTMVISMAMAVVYDILIIGVEGRFLLNVWQSLLAFGRYEFEFWESLQLLGELTGIWLITISPPSDLLDPIGRPVPPSEYSEVTTRGYLRFFATIYILGQLVEVWTHRQSLVFFIVLWLLNSGLVFFTYHFVQRDLVVRSEQPAVCNQAAILKWVASGFALVVIGIRLMIYQSSVLVRTDILEAYLLLALLINAWGALIFAILAQSYLPLNIRRRIEL